MTPKWSMMFFETCRYQAKIWACRQEGVWQTLSLGNHDDEVKWCEMSHVAKCQEDTRWIKIRKLKMLLMPFCSFNSDPTHMMFKLLALLCTASHVQLRDLSELHVQLSAAIRSILTTTTTTSALWKMTWLLDYHILRIDFESPWEPMGTDGNRPLRICSSIIRSSKLWSTGKLSSSLATITPLQLRSIV